MSRISAGVSGKTWRWRERAARCGSLLASILILAGLAKPQGREESVSQRSFELSSVQCDKPPRAVLTYNYNSIPSFGDITVTNQGTGRVLEPYEIAISCPLTGKKKQKVFHVKWDKKILEGEQVVFALPEHMSEGLQWAACTVTTPPIPTTPPLAVRVAAPVRTPMVEVWVEPVGRSARKELEDFL